MFVLFTLRSWKLYGEIIGAAALALVLITAITGADFAAVGGVFLYLLGGLLIGTEGKLAGMLRVDWFHYAISIGNLLLVISLTNKTRTAQPQMI